jgi:antitoxin (DNA-binding transcriptional repressor) of toxin-antitoxin stability system
MKFISVRDLRIKPKRVWEGLKKEGEIVITSNSKPIALLTKVDEETLETSIVAFRQSKAIMALEQMQNTSVKYNLDKITIDEIETEIKEVRN